MIDDIEAEARYLHKTTVAAVQKHITQVSIVRADQLLQIFQKKYLDAKGDAAFKLLEVRLLS